MGIGCSSGKSNSVSPEPTKEDDHANQKTVPKNPKNEVEQDNSDIREGNKQMFFGDSTYTIKYACYTQTGYYPDDLSKRNQDCFFCDPNFDTVEENGVKMSCCFFGVFDGHGQEGDKCSRFVRDNIATYLKNHPLYQTNFVQAYKDAFILINESLHDMKDNDKYKIDDSFSGTTAICGIIRGKDIFVANVGDSRAVCGSITEENTVIQVPLSVDQTPYRDDERRRVQECGAVIMTYDQLEGIRNPNDTDWGNEDDNNGDPPRLWIPGNRLPGTAFTRSIGDSIAEQIGVVAVPEILRHQLVSDDRYIIICSDGVFEFITSQHAVDIVDESSEPIEACRRLISQSYHLWLHNEVRTDDITAIVLFVSDIKDGIVHNRADAAMVDQKIKPTRKVINIKIDDSINEEELNYVFPESFSGTRKEYQDLLHGVRSNFLFRQLDEQMLDGVINAMNKIIVKSGDIVIKQGDQGDKFFIAYSGNYDVFINGPNGNQVLVHKYESTPSEFPSFGELALMYGRPRAASVVASTNGILFSLDRVAFSVILKRSTYNPVISTLRSVSIFESLNNIQIQTLASKLKTGKYQDHEYIIRQGDRGNTFYVIQLGEVICTKSEAPELPPVEVLRLNVNSYFGERALLGDGLRAANCIANGPVRTLEIDKNTFDDVLGPLQDLISKDRSKREYNAELENQYKQLQESLKIPSLTLDDLASIATIQTGDFYSYTIVKNRIDGHSFTLRTMSKSKIDSRNLGNSIVRERNFLMTHSFLFATLPVFFKVFQDKNALFFLYDSHIVCNIRTFLETQLLTPEITRYFVSLLVDEVESFQENDILFRGIDSSSIYVNNNGKLSLIELINAKICPSRTFTICGNPHYMSPQRINGQAHDYRSDNWAIGVLIYELFSGKYPFADNEKTSEIEIYDRIAKHSQPLSNPSLDVGVMDLVNGLLVVDPLKRLGCGVGETMQEVKKHRFFDSIDWDKILVIESPAYQIISKIYTKISTRNSTTTSFIIPPYEGDDEFWSKNF